MIFCNRGPMLSAQDSAFKIKILNPERSYIYLRWLHAYYEHLISTDSLLDPVLRYEHRNRLLLPSFFGVQTLYTIRGISWRSEEKFEKKYWSLARLRCLPLDFQRL